jgi:hypothetical protein
VFNRNPPPAYNAMADSYVDAGTYGVVGRMLYVDANIKF